MEAWCAWVPKYSGGVIQYLKSFHSDGHPIMIGVFTLAFRTSLKADLETTMSIQNVVSPSFVSAISSFRANEAFHIDSDFTLLASIL